MGLPQYVGHLLKRYPNVLHRRGSNSIIPTTNRLFLDFNSIIHRGATKALEAPRCSDEDVIRCTLKATRDIIKRVRPDELVYIAIDGMPPFSKMVQQRSRRFMGAAASSNGVAWDKNAITPGTNFMKKLSDALVQGLQQCPCPVIVSSSEEGGEGEIKIMRYLRDNIPRHDVVYGLDGDLIVHCMLLEARQHLYVMRDKDDDPSATMVLDMDMLRQRIVQDMGGNGSKSIVEYVLLLELVGSDFLPPLSFLNNKSFAIPYLISTYHRTVRATGRSIVVYEPREAHLDSCAAPAPDSRNTAGSWRINWDVFGDVLRVLGSQEDYRFPITHDKFISMAPWTTASVVPEDLPLYDKGSGNLILPHKAGWRREYYFHLLHFRKHVDERERACQCYLQGLGWMFRYYVDGSLSSLNSVWAYPFGYAPTAFDVSALLDARMNDIHETIIRPITSHSFPTTDTLFQLLLVLPPQSSHLLPSHVRRIVKDPALGCVAFYPTAFRIETYLKRFSWECHPLIPFPDLKLLYRAFKLLNDAQGSVCDKM